LALPVKTVREHWPMCSSFCPVLSWRGRAPTNDDCDVLQKFPGFIILFSYKVDYSYITSKRGANCKDGTFELWVCGSILSEITCEYESEGVVKGHKKLNRVKLKVILWNYSNNKPEICKLAQDLNRNVTTNGNMYMWCLIIYGDIIIQIVLQREVMFVCHMNVIFI
jgi:hypothetical protein